MPLEGATAVSVPAPIATIGPSRHLIKLVDPQGVTREYPTSGSVLVFDPVLATRCEAAGLEYVFVNLQRVMLCSVEARPGPESAGLEAAPAVELLESQLNGAHEGI